MRILLLVGLALAALALPPQAAQADTPVIVLFTGPDEQGARIRLTESSPELSALHFDNLARSIRVRRGAWRLCTENWSGGTCRRFDEGKHNLGNLAGRVSSVQVAQGGGGQGGGGSGGGGQWGGGGSAQAGYDLILYSERNGRGRDYGVTGDIYNMDHTGFNDTAQSVSVRDGTWELCSNSRYSGDCTTYGPGNHELNASLAGRLSSLHRVGGGQGGGGSQGGGNDEVVLYSEGGERGQSIGFDRDVASLVPYNWNDRAESVRINRGNWQFCRDVNYSGGCTEFGPGLHEFSNNLNRGQLSSLRKVHNNSNQGGGGSADQITIYAEPNGRGASFGANGQIANLESRGWNDRAESVTIKSGRWQLCVNAWFGGHCSTFGPGTHDLGGNLSQQLSSFREVN